MGVKITTPCSLMGSCLRDQIHVRDQFHASAALPCDKESNISVLYELG
jgi:hypothetical protein